MNEPKTSLEAELRAGHSVSTFTTGTSMQPLLYEKQTVVIAEPVSRRLTPGELPLVRRPDGVYLVHRVVEVGESFYFTRGDNCVMREKIPDDWVVGLVTQIHRKGRTIAVTDPGYRLYVWFWMHTARPRIFYKRLRGKLYRFLKQKR